MKKRMENKVAIITGGANGIGREICLLLAEEGAKIAILDINENKGKKLAEKIISKNQKARFWKVDVQNEKDIKKIFSEIYKFYKKIDLLVNNAGITGSNKFTHLLTEEEWDKVMNINVKGPFFCTKHVVPYFLKNKRGNIIYISSNEGIVSYPDFPPYHASKGAVRLMAKTDALIYAKNNIRVNSIHPGYIWTDLIKKQARAYPGGEKAFLKFVNSLHPIGHIGKPKDIAYGILYLASDESSYVTGSELVIDGGYTAK